MQGCQLLILVVNAALRTKKRRQKSKNAYLTTNDATKKKKKRYSTFEEKLIAIHQTTIFFKDGKYILMKSLLTSRKIPQEMYLHQPMVCFCKFQMQRLEIPNHKNTPEMYK